MSKECPICFGMGMIEHKRCNGMGCSGCIDGELICNRCSGFGSVDGEASNDMPINDEEMA